MTDPVKSGPGGGNEKIPAEYLARDQLPKLVRDTAPSDLATREREVRIQEYQIKQLQVQNVRAGTQIFVQLLIAAGLVVLVGLLIWQVWGATHANSVVVDDFHAPDELQRRGISGVVIASDLFDQMQQIQDATRPLAVQQGIHGGWATPIKLNDAERGALGGFGRYLRQWLGHETYISGEVVQDGDNSLRLTVRGTGIIAKSFSGKPESLPTLTQNAAEYVFEQAQPLMFATWLTQNARDADVVAMMQTAYGHAPPANRPALLNVWGNALDNLGQTDAALEKYKLSIKVKPDYWPGYTSLTDLQMRLGEEEGALQTGLTLERLSQRGSAGGGKAGSADYRYADLLRMNLPALRDTQSQSLAAGTDPSEGTATVHRPPSNAEVLARLHADKQAELELETTPGADTDPYEIADAAYGTRLHCPQPRRLRRGPGAVRDPGEDAARESPAGAGLPRPAVLVRAHLRTRRPGRCGQCGLREGWAARRLFRRTAAT